MTKAFTLIEMMAVVIIIGILAAVIGTNLVKPVDSAKVRATKASLKEIESAITMFRLDTSKYPEDLRELIREPDGMNGWNGPYLKGGSPKDGWGNKFEYRVPGNEGQAFDVWSNGGDGQEGGEGIDADIYLYSLDDE